MKAIGTVIADAVVIVFLAGSVFAFFYFVFIASNRKRQVGKVGYEPGRGGTQYYCATATFTLAEGDLDELIVDVLRSVGAWDVRELNDMTFVGWYPIHPILSFYLSSYTPREYGIYVIKHDGQSVELRCCCCYRYGFLWGVKRRYERFANDVAREFERLNQ